MRLAPTPIEAIESESTGGDVTRVVEEPARSLAGASKDLRFGDAVALCRITDGNRLRGMERAMV